MINIARYLFQEQNLFYLSVANVELARFIIVREQLIYVAQIVKIVTSNVSMIYFD